MKRRYLIVAASLAAFVCLVLGVLALLPARSGATKANFSRIEKGMPRAEVARIFGGPGKIPAPIPDVGTCWDCWRAENGIIAIEFLDGHAVGAEWHGHGSAETAPETIRRWLRWTWR
jgi:hypothetical protein